MCAWFPAFCPLPISLKFWSWSQSYPDCLTNLMLEKKQKKMEWASFSFPDHLYQMGEGALLFFLQDSLVPSPSSSVQPLYPFHLPRATTYLYSGLNFLSSNFEITFLPFNAISSFYPSLNFSVLCPHNLALTKIHL